MSKQVRKVLKRSADSRKKQSSIINHQSSIPYYHICPTAFGHAAILFQVKPFLVKRVLLPQPHIRALAERMEKTGPAKPGQARAALKLCEEVRAYFEGARITAPWERLDLGGLTPLQCAVLKAAASVPHGEVRSYSQIAAQVGHPRACRFVGTTLARNPFPILIPCHRVVRADGSPGGFAGGTDLKNRLLLLEKQQTVTSYR
jgi:methylated-DNA-[protein]-cysteine S-methyltransferase